MSILFYFVVAFTSLNLDVWSAAGSWITEIRILVAFFFCFCIIIDLVLIYAGVKEAVKFISRNKKGH